MENSAAIEISVIVCTHNRATTLALTLHSLAFQTVDPSRYEVIVVDNNSTDNTKDVVECSAAFDAPRVKYVFEARQGLSYARNAGIESAHGEIVAFTDDDVELSPSWVASIFSAFQKYACAAVQGRTILHCEVCLPSWLPDEYLDFLARVDRGPADVVWDGPLIGANMAFRKNVFERFGLFDVSLGVGQAGAYEETEFSHRLRGDPTIRVYYVGSALSVHKIPAGRLSKSYFRKRLYLQGFSWAKRYAGETSRTGVWVYTLRSLCKAAFLSGFQSLCGDRKSAFMHEGHIFYYLGVLRDLYFAMRCSLRMRWRKVVGPHTSFSG